jgi:hypothetical protein
MWCVSQTVSKLRRGLLDPSHTPHERGDVESRHVNQVNETKPGGSDTVRV